MPRSSNGEIVQGYIEEVKTYIPSLISGLEAMKSGLAASPEQPCPEPEVLEEIHRLAHTIKGASAMVGIYGLSHIAFQMEDTLDEILAGNLVFTLETFRVMSRTVEHFQTYCRDFLEKGVDSGKLLKETVLAFRRLRGLPSEEDEKILGKLLDIVPDHECGISDDEERHKQTEILKLEVPVKESFSVSDAAPMTELDEDEASLMALLDEVPEVEDGIPENIVPPDFPEMTSDKPADFSAESMPQGDENSVCLSSLSAEFLESFYEEAEEHFQDMRVSLKILESQIKAAVPLSPSYREIIRQIRRSVHTLKGASSVLQLLNISAYAGKTEEFLDWLCEAAQEISPEIVSVLAESADLLETIVADPGKDRIQKVKSLKARYKEIMNAGDGPEKELPRPEIKQSKTGLSISSPAVPQVRERSETKPDSAKPVSAEQAVPDVPPELLESFYEEAEGHLQDLGRSVGILESQISSPGTISPEHREIIRQIRRSVHTLKGAASVIGLPNISAFAHSAEDLLDWLYESAQEISPEIIAVLAASADLLESLVAQPGNAREPEAQALREKFRRTTEGAEVRDEGTEEKTEPLPPSPEPLTPNLEPQISTLRVSMDRLDEMVNLAGELIIALSAFDQGMDAFMNAVSELDLARERLRDIARDMEIGYEGLFLTGSLDRLNAGVQHPKSAARSLKLPAMKSSVKGASAVCPNGAFEDFDALELDRYSQLNLIIRTLNESAVDVGALNIQLANVHSEFDGNLTRQRVLLSELQDKMMRVRMTPMRTLTNKLRRTVREVSTKLGKKIRLIITGEAIELDREIWEKITDPLMHLIRNAADHGIEPPALRQALGKPPAGLLKLAGSREGNQVVIRISDDGSGLNRESIRRTAVRSGFSEKAVAEMSEDELISLIFQPGFSTRGEVSEISGRGIGMDVVKQNIEELKGVIRVFSQEGKGTRFTIRIPMTLAVIRGLLFTAGGYKFAIALNEIKEIIRIEPDDIMPGPPEELVKIGDEVMPIYHAATVLNIRKGSGVRGQGSGGASDHASKPEPRTPNPIVLVVGAEDRRVALIIDALEGQREIVIKSTGTHLRYVKGVSGVTIMGDGSVVPILNAAELFRTSPGITAAAETHGRMSLPLAEKPMEIMIVDDSVSIRQVVSRLMEEQGWTVQTAKDGIDALEKLRDSLPDLIVLDIEMPRMNGYEFLNALRVQPAYRNIPVIMLTSRTAAKHRDKALSLGAKGFIVKPYNNDEFIALILKLTDGE